MVTDRYSDKEARRSPYHYAVNNPVLIVDINGDSISPRGMVLGNEKVVERLENMNNILMDEHNVGNNEFIIYITGGDRFKTSDGSIRSSSNGQRIPGSADDSNHLEQNGGRAVDFELVAGDLSQTDLQSAAEQAGFEWTTTYADGHVHARAPEEDASSFVRGRIPTFNGESTYQPQPSIVTAGTSTQTRLSLLPVLNGGSSEVATDEPSTNQSVDRRGLRPRNQPRERIPSLNDLMTP